MSNENYLEISSKLYEKIFGEKIDNSIEFTNFVRGNPHLLRMKIEEELVIVNTQIMDCLKVSDYRKLIQKRDLLKELEQMIMEFIENNI